MSEYVEELRGPEALSPTETFEVGPAPAKPIEPSIDEYVEELRQPEPLELSTPSEPIAPIEAIELQAEPIAPIVDGYVVPPSDIAFESAPPSTPDPRLAALWDAA